MLALYEKIDKKLWAKLETLAEKKTNHKVTKNIFLFLGALIVSCLLCLCIIVISIGPFLILYGLSIRSFDFLIPGVVISAIQAIISTLMEVPKNDI